MSSIIKSQKVSVGLPVGLNNKYAIKAADYNPSDSELISGISSDGVNFRWTPDMEESIMNKYIKEAQEKSELLFEVEMKKAREQGIALSKAEADEIMNNAKQEADIIIAEAAEIRGKAVLEYKEYIKNAEGEIVSLAIEIAEKIVSQKINEDSEYIISVIEESMARIISKKDVILRVSEEDYSTIIGNEKVILGKIEGFGDVNIVKEGSLLKGSCIVETPLGTIDGGIDTRLEQIKIEIEKILNR